MPRRGSAASREIQPDTRHGSVLLARFINNVMVWGKKSVAERVVYDAFDMIHERMDAPPLEVFEQAVQNAMPVLEVKPRRIGGATYQVPVEVLSNRRLSLALRWLVGAARSRPGKTMAERVANELMDAARRTGAAVKKREDTHRMAEANKAFAHYRW